MILKVQTIADLATLFEFFAPEQIQAEHRAIHYKVLEEAIQAKKLDGFELILKRVDMAFMKRDNEIHELIPSNWFEYEAYVVSDSELIRMIRHKIEQKSHYPFFVNEHFEGKLLKFLMLIHRESRNVIQIIWRTCKLV